MGVVRLTCSGSHMGPLTTREREIAEDISYGLSMKEIATKRFISPRTADTHRQNLYGKLGVHNAPEMMRTMIERGELSIHRHPVN